MTVSVLHQKVSAIADDPASVAAGEVVPSDWNAEHTISGVLDVANGGTGVTTSTGTGSVVLSTGPTFAPDVVMSGSSSNPILRITQTGAGHALLIEDEASTDATPVVVNNAGSVILGSTTQPAVGTVGSHKITVSGATAADASFLCYRSDVSAGPATFTFGKTRGADPLDSGDVLGRLEAAGRDATAAGGGDERTPIARIEFAADGAPALDNMPGRIIFQTTPSGSNTPADRMRIRSDGNIGIGSSGAATAKIFIGGTYASSGGFSSGYEAAAVIPSGTTATHAIFDSKAYTQAAAFTLNLLKHYSTAQPTAFSGGSVVITQAAFHAGSNLTGATNNYGFYSDIAAATNRWNFFANGTAQNYFAGNTGIGGLPTTDAFRISGTASGGTTINGLIIDQTVGSGVTANYRSVLSRPILQNATFTLTNLYHFYANPQTKPAAATLSNQYGFHAESTLTDATSNYGFYSNIAAAANRWNFYANGTAQNYFAGNTFIGATTGDQALNVNGAVRVAAITSANQTSAGTMDFTGGNLRFLCWGASGTQGIIQWLTGTGASGATVRMTLNGSNNLGLATATFGTSATNTFSIASGTAPSSGVADTVQLYSSDLSAGNTIPSWYTEGTNVGTGTPAANRTIALRFNGTVYYLLASTIP